MPDPNPAPRLFRGVMVSSTFTDLKEHRAALIEAIENEELKAVAMEHDSAKLIDVIESSLHMVRDASAYIVLISRKYGQTPVCPQRNPGERSITELEFDEAMRLRRPILLFIMGEKHPILEADVEFDSERRKKLSAFRERAKQMTPDSKVHRVYETFNSLEEFKTEAIHAVAGLRRFLEERGDRAPQPEAPPAQREPIPYPPEFYAEPPYLPGSQRFVGRAAQLDFLDDWALAADPHPVLLFDAIGGSGKSMLTWQWTTSHSTKVRQDWVGRFWYSFYERGAVMADFCRRALAYITGEPIEEFRKLKTVEMADRLLHHLRNRPWLLVLDGLERVLVAYQRIDAAELADEEANRPSDQIANRDPCAAIRPEDDELFRALAAAAPSKILITSRLIPRVLLNPASQPIAGALRASLPGLRPPDAEELFVSCGIRGSSQAIQDYLKTHCDNHPLVTVILAGLVNDYFPDRGNFDAWSADPEGGGRLNLAELDLVQKRNHILQAAFNALSEKSRKLISIFGLLSEAVDYGTLNALFADTRQELADALRDLERRGFIQYDGQTRRYDVHPVVRSVATGRLGPEERDTYGQRVVDHFSARVHVPYEQAETLEDVRDGIHVVRTLVRMGRFQDACSFLRDGLDEALDYNLEAHDMCLSLMRPFFPIGWATIPPDLEETVGANLVNEAALTLQNTGALEQALTAYGTALRVYMGLGNLAGSRVVLSNISGVLNMQNRLAAEDRVCRIVAEVAALRANPTETFCSRLAWFRHMVRTGRWGDAQSLWDLLDPMGRKWPRRLYRPGDAEFWHAWFQFCRGQLSEEDLTRAEALATEGRNRRTARELHGVRGAWRLERGEWALAAASLGEAVSMARAAGQTDAVAETQLALARFHLGQLPDPQREAEQLAKARKRSEINLAHLWFAIGDSGQAAKHALAAYRLAWADGEPYVWRYHLSRSRELLEKLGEKIPDLPPYDPAKDTKFDWEDEVIAAIRSTPAPPNARTARPTA
jgi:tetratricopeptide (TPR) repeat protein